MNPLRFATLLVGIAACAPCVLLELAGAATGSAASAVLMGAVAVPLALAGAAALLLIAALGLRARGRRTCDTCEVRR